MEKISLWEKIQNYLPDRDDSKALFACIMLPGILMCFLGFSHEYSDETLNGILRTIGSICVVLGIVAPFLISFEQLPYQAMTDISLFNWCPEAKTELKKMLLKKKNFNTRDLQVICDLQHNYFSQAKQDDELKAFIKAKEKILQN